MNQIKELVQCQEQCDLLSLTETKLTKEMYLKGWKSQQTKLLRYGSVWQGSSSSNRVKRIKSFDSSISWMSAAYDFTPVHLVSCYIQPQNAKVSDKVLANLNYILQLILDRLPQSRDILSGDFNERRAEVERLAEKFKLKPLIQEGIPTHSRVGHLIKFSQTQRIQKRSSETNNSQTIESSSPPWNSAKLNRIQIYDKCQLSLPKVASGSSRLQCLLDHIMSPEYSFSTPFIEVTQNNVPQSKIICQWYSQPKRLSLKPKKDEGDLDVQFNNNWQEVIQRLEHLHRENQSAAFYELVRKLTRIKPSSTLIKGLTLDSGETVFDSDEISRIILKRFQAPSPTTLADTAMTENMFKEIGLPLSFDKEDIRVVIKETNFEKAIGPDGFDGKAIKMSTEIEEKCIEFLLKCLQEANLPNYFNVGRLTALSKQANETIVEESRARPIIIKPHLSKITEKAIMNKLVLNHKHLIQTGSYQTGFKEGQSTLQHLSNIMKRLKTQKRKPSTRRPLVLIDLAQAYDRVPRERVFQILRKRCQSAADWQIVDLIERLHLNQYVQVGQESISIPSGVAQGSVLSPLLFNIFLEECLKSSKVLSQCIQRGDLLAYADDIIIQACGLAEAQQIISEFDELGHQWGIRINRKKCEIMSHQNISAEATVVDQIAGVQVVSKVKYLGVTLTTDPQETLKIAKQAIRRHIACFKWRLRTASINIKQQILTSYAKSLLIYYGVPLHFSGAWSNKQIDNYERQLFREILLLPNDVPGQTILNVAQEGDNTSLVIARLAKKIGITLARQSRINLQGEENQQAPSPPYRQKLKHLFIPKALADTIFACSRGSTQVHFGRTDFCTQHSVVADLVHLEL